MSKLYGLIASFAIAAFASSAHAWEPNGPVTVTITAPAGSLHDTTFKTILPTLEEQTGVDFIIDYKPGAASVKGTNHFLSLPADGQNITLTASLSLVLSDISSPEIAKWDWDKDFVYISGIAHSTTAVTVSEAGRFKTINDLANAIASGEKVVIATTYPNSEAIVRLLAQSVGSDGSNIKFVKYKNPAAALTDVVGGSADVFVSGLSPAIPLQQAGKVRFLATTGTERLEFLPDVPTLSSVIPNFVMTVDMGISVKAGTPQEAVDWYVAAITKAVKTEAAKQARDKVFLNLDNAFIGPEGQRTYYIANRKTWEKTYMEMYGSKK